MRKLGPFQVNEIGLGCMNLSHAYGVPPSPEQGKAVLHEALELGVDHFDSAALYGFGRNEELVGPYLKPHRDELVLVSKCGMRGENGVRTIDSSPAKLREDIENSLRRLQTDVIDLYYLHRYDKVTPIEDSVGEMSRFVEEGKVRAIGLSEVSSETIRKAHVVHPIAAVQSEYSLWSRNVEIGVLDTCAELGTAFVAFSPLGRGFLTSVDLNPSEFAEKDIRRRMPRFQEPHFSKNCHWLSAFQVIADEAGLTPAQLALAWVLQRHDFIHVIPGTTSVSHLHEDWDAKGIVLSANVCQKLQTLVNEKTVSGSPCALPIWVGREM
jgi:aryl-alcohol dehydrogenase-like predicted oxidoreductase